MRLVQERQGCRTSHMYHSSFDATQHGGDPCLTTHLAVLSDASLIRLALSVSPLSFSLGILLPSVSTLEANYSRTKIRPPGRESTIQPDKSSSSLGPRWNQTEICSPIAVAGLGRMGKRHVATLQTRVSWARVVAVCSAAPQEVEWARNNPDYVDFGVKAYDTYEEMLMHLGLQAVWIATSTDVHASQTIKAVERGLHVLCEKPLSTDLDEVQAAINAAISRPDLKVMAGFSRRFDASYRDAHQKVQAGAIGEPYLIRSNTCDLLDETGFFATYARRNGGIFVDCTIHDIDLALWFLGDATPKSCFAVGTLRHHPELAEARDVDNGIGIVEFHGGLITYFHASRTQAHGHDTCTEITGTRGKVMVNVVPRANNVVLADKLGMRHEVQPEYWQRFEDAFATEAVEFVDCVLHDRPVPVSLESGYKVMKIARALQESLLSGKIVKFDEQGKRIGDL